MKIKDAIVGASVGKLKILEILNVKNLHNKKIAKCICECGVVKNFTINNLGNSTISCGCVKSENIKSRMSKDIVDKMSAKILLACKRNDKNTELSIDNVRHLIYSKCYYCGIDSQSNLNINKNKSYKNKIKKLGIDRIDNDKGYTIVNSVAACYTCNRIKLNSKINFINNFYLKIANNASNLANNQNIEYKKSLNIKHNKNCNCFSKNPNVKSFDLVVAAAVKNASIQFGIKNTLDLNQISNIIFNDRCYYCERSILEAGVLKKKNGYTKESCQIYRLGIDRINSLDYYNINNVVPCCKFCNKIKCNYSLEIFSKTCFNIFNKLKGIE